MYIPATEFTPLSALAGGVMIGLAAVWFLLSSGRIAGVSGIVSGLIPPFSPGVGVNLAFVAGLAISPIAYSVFPGGTPEQTMSSNLWLLGAAGMLVGFGSRLGSGCTSGHGVCGIARLSWRSIIATITFVATAMATVYVTRHMIGG